LSDQFGLLARHDVDGEIRFKKREDSNPVNDPEIEERFGNVSTVFACVLVDVVATVPGISAEIGYTVAMDASLREKCLQTGFELAKGLHFIWSQRNNFLLAERQPSPGRGERH
jgi:hypothetical protein